MVLTATTLLQRKIQSSTTSEDLNIHTLVCYGMLMGQTYTMKLLKLSIDFDAQILDFEELFSLHPCVVYPVYVDIVLDHILKSLEMC